MQIPNSDLALLRRTNSSEKMPVFEAPHEIDAKDIEHTPSIFLAGGISGCGDWQADVARTLSNNGWVVFNPRRENFDVADENVELEQISWEHKYLSSASHVLFWFPCETLCPITLFELGSQVYRPDRKKLFVGVHPDYKRKRDVEIQLSLQLKGADAIPVVHSIEDLVNSNPKVEQ